MALDIYFPQDLRQGLAGALALTLETARATGPINADYLRGVLALARAQALNYGIPWGSILADVRAATGGQEYDAMGLLAPGHTGDCGRGARPLDDTGARV